MIHSAFSRSGYKSCHWDNGNLAKSIYNSIMLGVEPLAKYPSFEVFSDIECVLRFPGMPPRCHGVLYQPYKQISLLHAYYPNSVFIYNKRNISSWIDSRLRHGNGSYAMLYLWNLLIASDGAIRDIPSLIEAWKREWTAHDKSVESFREMHPSSIFAYQIETDGLGIINSFLTDSDLPILAENALNSEIGANPSRSIDFDYLNFLASKTYSSWLEFSNG